MPINPIMDLSSPVASTASVTIDGFNRKDGGLGGEGRVYGEFCMKKESVMDDDFLAGNHHCCKHRSAALVKSRSFGQVAKLAQNVGCSLLRWASQVSRAG